MFELCKKDQPQWIRISWMWNAETLNKTDPRIIINNFNFDYVYNFSSLPKNKRKTIPTTACALHKRKS